MSEEYPLDTPLAVSLEFGFQSPQKPRWWCPAAKGRGDQGAVDVDNCVKAILDAGNEVVWKDDVQVVTLAVTKCFSPEHYVEMAVWSLNEGEL